MKFHVITVQLSLILAAVLLTGILFADVLLADAFLNAAVLLPRCSLAAAALGLVVVLKVLAKVVEVL